MAQTFVLDCSVAMSWCFIDESSSYSDAVLDSLTSATAIVPSLWWLEACNILIMAEKCNRIKESDRVRSLHLLRNLPIRVEPSSLYSPDELILLCQEHKLTAYDGIYLLIALSKGLSIASLDNKLNQAALKSGCGIYMRIPDSSL